jgi:hypothetical protein
LLLEEIIYDAYRVVSAEDSAISLTQIPIDANRVAEIGSDARPPKTEKDKKNHTAKIYHQQPGGGRSVPTDTV